MNEKSQASPGEEQEDLLEQIFTQGLEKIKTPAQVTTMGEAPPENASSASGLEDSGKPAPSKGRKNRRSAVYLYLLVLFGAAFLMLLLAYFAQQRSSENAISDLRDSMKLSREELLAQVRALEEQNTVLIGDTEMLKDLSNLWRQRYEEKSQEANTLSEQYHAAQGELYSWDSFWMLEQFYQLENYEACAAILLLQLQGQTPYCAPNGAERRHEEIVRAVILAGILDEDYVLHPEKYQTLLDAYSSP